MCHGKDGDAVIDSGEEIKELLLAVSQTLQKTQEKDQPLVKVSREYIVTVIVNRSPDHIPPLSK